MSNFGYSHVFAGVLDIMKEKFINNKVIAGSFIMVAGSTVINAINYFYHLIMGRILGPSEYAVLASMFSLYYLIAIVPQSAGVGIVKFSAECKDKKELAFLYGSLKNVINKLALYMSIILVLLSPLINNFLHLNNFWIVVLLAPILYFSLNTMLNQSIMQGILRFGAHVNINLVASLGKLIIGILLVLAGFAAFGAIAGLALATAFTYLFSRIYIDQEIKTPRLGRDLKDFLSFSAPALLQALAFTAFFSLDLILVKHYFAPYDAGLYAALSTLGKIIFFAASPISMVMFPLVSGKKAKNESFKQVFYLTFTATVLLSIFVVSTYYLIPNIAIGFLYGKEYLSVTGELFWMGLFLSFYTLAYYLANFMLSIGKTKSVILPAMILIFQTVGIVLWHKNLLQVIQVSLVSMLVLLVGQALYLISFLYFKNDKK